MFLAEMDPLQVLIDPSARPPEHLFWDIDRSAGFPHPATSQGFLFLYRVVGLCHEAGIPSRSCLTFASVLRDNRHHYVPPGTMTGPNRNDSVQEDFGSEWTGPTTRSGRCIKAAEIASFFRAAIVLLYVIQTDGVRLLYWHPNDRGC